jgi:hypothetical protein
MNFSEFSAKVNVVGFLGDPGSSDPQNSDVVNLLYSVYQGSSLLRNALDASQILNFLLLAW